MPSKEDVVRAAVQAALHNESLLDPPPPVSNARANPVVAVTPPPKPKSSTKRPKQLSTKPARAGAAPDSNWKKLRKTLTKRVKGPGHHKRPRVVRSPTGAPPATSPATPPAAAAAPATPLPDAKFSSFMKRRVTSTTEVSRAVAIDCEMVGVGPAGAENALARVSVVNYSGDVLYDTLVRVHEAVTDYRTAFSGIRAEDVSPLNAAAVEPAEAQRAVGELLKGRVLVGHAVRNDLAVLRLKHPRRDVRDTAEFYKRLWGRGGRGRPPALRAVVAKVLGVDAFQKEEHDSCEDARAALMLYKRNAKAWEKEVRDGRGGGGARRAKAKRKVVGAEE